MMDNEEILLALGLSLGPASSRSTYYWCEGRLNDVPPVLREWAMDELVNRMRNTGQRCGVYRKISVWE